MFRPPNYAVKLALCFNCLTPDLQLTKAVLLEENILKCVWLAPYDNEVCVKYKRIKRCNGGVL